MALNTADRPASGAKPAVKLERKDNWWVEPLLTVSVLVVFLLYGLWRAFENRLFDTHRSSTLAMPLHMHYLSPFYSPPIQDWFHLPFNLSGALFVLAFPGMFRFTCYFCRRSYYRAFFWDPPACAVREIVERKNYTGERQFPFVLQNLHRYALYFIFIFVIFHWIHLAQAMSFTDASGNAHFGLGLGTLVLAVDSIFLTLYVTSCHSFRHLVGGVVNWFSRNGSRYSVWKGVTALNEKHGLFFWLSLFSVGFADLYVRLVCSGAITDLRIF